MSYLRIEHRAMVDTVRITPKPFASTGGSNNLAFVTFADLAGAEGFIKNKCVTLERS